MAYTLQIPLDAKKIMADAQQFTMATEFWSGENLGHACSLADYENDIQFRLLYELLTAAHARALIDRLDPHQEHYRTMITSVSDHFTAPYANVEFATKAEAMLFKLAHGGAA
jgi:hypothetical protein